MLVDSSFFHLTFLVNSPAQKVNQVVIWDKIILRGDNALLNYHGMNTKYYFFDDGLGLKYVETSLFNALSITSSAHSSSLPL